MRRTRHFPYFGFAGLRVELRRAEEVLSAINEDTTDGYGWVRDGQGEEVPGHRRA